jgi:transposase
MSPDIAPTVAVTARMRTRLVLCSSGTVGRSRTQTLASRLAARRLVGVGMVARGASQAEVARQLDVTREAVRQWVDAWRAGGPAALAPRPRRRRRRVELDRIARAIDEAYGDARQPLTARRVRRIIERVFRVKYCASSARGILHRLGFAFTRKHGWRRLRPQGGRAARGARPRVGAAHTKDPKEEREMKRRAS